MRVLMFWMYVIDILFHCICRVKKMVLIETFLRFFINLPFTLSKITTVKCVVFINQMMTEDDQIDTSVASLLQ